jgi:hypothetical protein
MRGLDFWPPLTGLAQHQESANSTTRRHAKHETMKRFQLIVTAKRLLLALLGEYLHQVDQSCCSLLQTAS